MFETNDTNPNKWVKTIFILKDYKYKSVVAEFKYWKIILNNLTNSIASKVDTLSTRYFFIKWVLNKSYLNAFTVFF